MNSPSAWLENRGGSTGTFIPTLAASYGQAENAQIFYDAYRCARCPQPLAVGSSADLGSSFFQMIDLLHARLHDAPNTPGTMAI